MQTFKYNESLNESMATITINLNNKLSEHFRATVKKEKGEGKGIIGKAVEEALTLWIKEKEEEEIVKRQLEIIKNKGYKTGKVFKYTRENLHERNL